MSDFLMGTKITLSSFILSGSLFCLLMIDPPFHIEFTHEIVGFVYITH